MINRDAYLRGYCADDLQHDSARSVVLSQPPAAFSLWLRAEGLEHLFVTLTREGFADVCMLKEFKTLGDVRAIFSDIQGSYVTLSYPYSSQCRRA